MKVKRKALRKIHQQTSTGSKIPKVAEEGNKKKKAKIEIDDARADENDTAEDSDDDEESEGNNDIRLDGNIEHQTEEYTFEFNDMKDEYAEGICTMLKKMVQNPTRAYEVASLISSQCEYFILVLHYPRCAYVLKKKNIY
jgi:hypothetical protein